MNCETTRAWLYRYVDGGLLEEDAQAVRDHVERCSDCRDRLTRIARRDEESAIVEDEAPSTRLRAHLLTEYRRRVSTVRKPPVIQTHGPSHLRIAAMLVFSIGLSSLFTALALQEPKSPPVVVREESAMPAVRFDRLFPIVTTEPYTLVHADGRKEVGWSTRIIN